MEVDGINLAVGGGAVTAIAGVVGAWIKAKFGKTQIPQPMETSQVGPFVTCGECKQHRAAIGKRIDGIEATSGAILRKLDEIDTRAEERAQQTHRRLDPFIQELGAVRGKMEVIEKAALNATMGGKK